MQEYLQDSRFGRAMDGIGFHFLALFVSFFWFVLLWGLRLPAVTAAMALYVLILLLRRKILDDHLVRKEKALRAAIGGELALERLLLSPAERAHFETAILLSMQYPLVLLRTGEDGTLCGLRGKKILLYFVQLPASSSLNEEAVLSLQRRVRQLMADEGLLCVPCAISQKAIDQSQTSPPIHFYSRDQLISLFGRVSPATDEHLVALGRRKRSRPRRKLLHMILDPQKARRYTCYGCLLLLMHLFTRLFFYAAAGLLCVGLAAACRCVRKKNELFL